MEEEEGKESEASGEESRMIERFLKTRTILACEPISDKLARRMYQGLLLLEDADPDKVITIIVNSPGGDADSGFGIMDMIRFVKCPIRTLVAGLCASAGVLVALAADKDQRFSLPNSRFLLHQPMTATFGQASDLEIASMEILKLRDAYNQVVVEVTGKDLAQVTRDADRDFWMSAQEALEYGLLTRVITSRQELE
ncbi:MAG: ATP-dependent Clp protease proteolytic subunit [Candidatus Eisenbacteria bacterium]|uniref:ATP-dependent Clp protease proteolytic subunit n=1 Tax=Eiseniibacteriota bacterium TaxID=2212470 RepID=A0A948WEW4_UNCEI|nr:ATP-dependent Clp protease proteolytic subunit [Candidatus Eisenbacteria bacterium]MBU1947375.1 ATP-dependent Clp protease proteolytic subunit [Candidatus Eisenbacteria bacterium]MBU2693143.1 ATP-dependent Clp protease proteolytic subunit [Candidatus Eisenbacteria bacterium]